MSGVVLKAPFSWDALDHLIREQKPTELVVPPRLFALMRVRSSPGMLHKDDAGVEYINWDIGMLVKVSQRHPFRHVIELEYEE